ncbi:hypothetical protein R80B4_02273 [Fibrobacteres bacterium R8-0-B4]
MTNSFTAAEASSPAWELTRAAIFLYVLSMAALASLTVVWFLAAASLSRLATGAMTGQIRQKTPLRRAVTG